MKMKRILVNFSCSSVVMALLDKETMVKLKSVVLKLSIMTVNT